MRKVSLLLMILVLLAACRPDKEADGPRTVSDWQPTPLAERPDRDGFDLEATPPTNVPTVIATVTATEPAEPPAIPTMAPTPVPANVFFSETNGFTVPFPSNWEHLDSGADYIVVYDPDLDVVVRAATDFVDEESGFDAFLDEFLAEDTDFYAGMAVESQRAITFAGGQPADSALMVGQDEDGNELAIWTAYHLSEARFHFMVAFGTPKNVRARQASLRAIFEQARPAGQHVYGLPRDETLVLLGYDPIPRDLDPALQLDSAASYIGLLYRGLVRLSPELQAVPDLAESWEVSDDGSVYTFTLREDLKFHDGKSITAADFKASWERAADPDLESSTVGTYLGDIVGVAERLRGEAETIEGVQVVDDRTLVVTLDGPKSYFLLKLTYPTSFVLDLDAVDEDDDEWVFEPNASGPYTLSRFDEEAALVFERNDNYPEPANITNVVFLLYRVGSQVSLFESGEVDIVGLWGAEAKRVRQPDDELHDRWQSVTGLSTSYLVLNNSMPPFDDPNVRLAFALAVDKEAYNEIVSEGTEIVAQTILPPAMPGYSTDLAQELSNRGFDPEAAQAALAASAYADGLPPITFSAGGYGTAESDDINALVANWEEILGVEVTVEYLDPEDYMRTARENHGHIVDGGWAADYPDPENFLDVLFHTESEFNMAEYSNPDFDALMEEARNELDPQRRLALYQELEAALLADVAVIPLLHGQSDELVNSRVRGYLMTPMAVPIIDRLSLEPVGEGD